MACVPEHGMRRRLWLPGHPAGAAFPTKADLKQCSARTRFGTAKVQQELKVILQKQWRDLGNRQARALGKVLFHIDCERTKDTRGVNLAVIFASKLVWPYYDAVEIYYRGKLVRTEDCHFFLFLVVYTSVFLLH